MALPAGVTSGQATIKAPVSFGGTPAKVYLEVVSNVALNHIATGTPIANFIDVRNPGAGQEAVVTLPHTDQSGFQDESGAPVTNWSYAATIRYELDGQLIHIPVKHFQILVGQNDIDLALIPVGTASEPIFGNVAFVSSINGESGAITLTKDDVGLANVDNTSDADKPIPTLVTEALALKAPLESPTFTGTVGGVTKSMVGLGAVDNTSDVDKPVSTLQQAALDAKADDADLAAKADASALALKADATEVALKATKGFWPINAKEAPYNAVGDGVADDTAALQAALDAVPVGGCDVYIPAGRYKISATLQIKQDGTKLYGAGAANRDGATQTSIGTRLEASGAITGSMLLVQGAANTRPLQGVTLTDLTLDGGLIGAAVDGVIFRVNQGHIERVHIWRASGVGLRLKGYGAPLWDTYDTVVANSLVGLCTGDGVVCDTDTADLHFSHCIFLTNYTNFHILGGASMQVTGCHFYSPNMHDIHFDGSGSRARFVNCKIEGSKSHHVLIDTTNGGYADIQFTSCGFSSLNQTMVTNTSDYVHIMGPSANGASRTTFTANNFNMKGGATVKARYAINVASTAAQSTFIIGNVFGPASHWGTAVLNNATNSTLLTQVRGNAGLGDVKQWLIQAASYTLVSTDADSVIEMQSASAVTLTIPPASTGLWVRGQTLEVIQTGAGQVTFAAGAGVTIRTPRSLTTRAQWSTVRLRYRATNEWVLDGDLT